MRGESWKSISVLVLERQEVLSPPEKPRGVVSFGEEAESLLGCVTFKTLLDEEAHSHLRTLFQPVSFHCRREPV